MKYDLKTPKGRFKAGEDLYELGKEYRRGWHKDVRDGYKLAKVGAEDEHLLGCIQSLMSSADDSGVDIHVKF